MYQSAQVSTKVYKEAKKDASKWRTGFQETFVTAKAKERGLSEEVVIKQMKREKESKEKGLNSRIIRGRNNKAPVVRAIANYEVNTHEAIVEAAAPSFLMRQKQTEDTPFMMSPLLDTLWYLAESPAADDIIDGRYRPPPGIDPYACEFIEVLAMPASIRAKCPVNCIATVEEHHARWKAQKARTASDQSTIGLQDGNL